MTGLSQGICSSNLKSVSLAILEQLHLTPKNLRGSLDPGPAPVRKIFKGHVWTVPKNMPAKFEVRSCNRVGIISTYFPKRGHVTLAIPPFQKKFRGHVQTVPGNMSAKFEVRSFESIGSRQRT